MMVNFTHFTHLCSFGHQAHENAVVVLTQALQDRNITQSEVLIEIEK